MTLLRCQSLWSCPCHLVLACPQKGTCSGEGKQQRSGDTQAPSLARGHEGVGEKVQRWEVRSQTTSCRQLTWVKNTRSGFRGAKLPVHHLHVSAPALPWTELSSRLGRVLFLIWMCTPAWLKAKEMSVQPQPTREACCSPGCSFPLDPCNYWAITYIITSWTPHYRPNLGECFSTGYVLSTCLSSLTSISFQSALMVPEIAEDVTSRSPLRSGSEAGWWTLWNGHHDSFWKQHF